MNIDQFKSIIDSKGLLDPTRYTVNIVGPLGGLGQDLSVLCSSVTLPGRGFSTADKYTHGPNRKVPYAELFDDVQTSFYITRQLDVYNYFIKWQEFIGGKDFYVAYYKDLIGSVIINVEDRKDSAIASYELFEAWPKSVSNIELSYGATGIVPILTVSWAYHHFEKKG